jgi:DNA-binding ferritin-like protein
MEDKPSLKNLIQKTDKSKYNTFCASILMCADAVKLAHFKTTSYAAHVALGDLYDQLTDHADTITELIQGYKGLLNISLQGVTYQEPIPYLEKIRTSFISVVESLEEEMPDVSNKIQDMIGDISKALYKLNNLS